MILDSGDKPAVYWSTFRVRNDHRLGAQIDGRWSDGALRGSDKKRAGDPYTGKPKQRHQHKKGKPFHASGMLGHKIR